MKSDGSEVDSVITEADCSLAAEFKVRPFGPHSGELQRLLVRIRSQPVAGRYALHTIVPHREWALIKLGPARGGKIELVENVRYTSPEEAEWDVFKRRWREMTDLPLEID
jgi:hypothetical protein